MEEKDILNKVNKELPFQIPDKYFDELPNRISDKILKEDSKKFSIIRFLKPFPVALAASLLILFGLFNLNLLKNNDTISHEELSDYIIESELADDVDIDFILNTAEIADNDLLPGIKYSDEEFESVQNYLIEQEIDINDIINEL